jgi:hypothetical protein
MKTNQNMSKRFELLLAVLLTLQVFWDMTSFHWVSTYKSFKGLFCPHLKGQAVPEKGQGLVGLESQDTTNVQNARFQASASG